MSQFSRSGYWYSFRLNCDYFNYFDRLGVSGMFHHVDNSNFRFLNNGYGWRNEKGRYSPNRRHQRFPCRTIFAQRFTGKKKNLFGRCCGNFYWFNCLDVKSYWRLNGNRFFLRAIGNITCISGAGVLGIRKSIATSTTSTTAASLIIAVVRLR